MTGDGSELVNRFYEAMLGGEDIDAVLALLAPDFQLVYSGPSIIPAASTWEGHDG
jgi:ketosteroid isomerase-like protein